MIDKGAVFIEHYFRDKICFESNLPLRGGTPHFMKSGPGRKLAKAGKRTDDDESPRF